MILSLPLLLSSCGLFKAKTITVYETVPIYADVQPRPKPVELLPTSFNVVSDKNLEAFLSDNRRRYNGIVFVAMDVPTYENISYNMQEINRYLREQQALIDYYEREATPPEEIKDDVPETE
jgi:hypothetical protein